MTDFEEIVGDAFAAAREKAPEQEVEAIVEDEEEGAEAEAEEEESEEIVEDLEEGSDDDEEDEEEEEVTPEPKGKRAKREYAEKKKLEAENLALLQRLSKLEGMVEAQNSQADKTKDFLEQRLKQPDTLESQLAEHGKDIADFYDESAAQDFLETRAVKAELEALKAQQAEQAQIQQAQQITNNVTDEVNGIIKHYKTAEPEVAKQIEAGVSLAIKSKAQELLMTGNAQNNAQAEQIAQMQIMSWAQGEANNGKFQTPSHAVLAYAGNLLQQAGGINGLSPAQKKVKMKKNDIKKTQDMAGKAPVDPVASKGTGTGRKGFTSGYNSWLKEAGIDKQQPV